MKKAIILHGRPGRAAYLESDNPSPSNSHWIPWLQRELLRIGILAQAPEALSPYEPTYEGWKTAIEYFNPDRETLLVGHSCGGGMVVQWLSKNPEARVGKVVLVAPWIDLEKNDWPAFDFSIDKNLISRTKGLTIFHSTNDSEEIQSSVAKLRKDFSGLRYIELKDKGHFTHSDLPNDTFPELLEECLKENP